MSKKSLKIFGLVFIVLIIMVMLINVIVRDRTFSEEENRILESKPKFSISSYFSGRFQKSAERYSDDQFFGRNFFIRIKTAFELAMGKNNSNNVFSGKDHYLLEDVAVPDVKSLEKNCAALASFRESYADLSMSFLLAPTSVNINSDHLPVFAVTADQNKYMDDFYKKISDIGYKTIEIREEFKSKKDDAQLYYRTDHHWTSTGAFIAYDVLKKELDYSDTVEYEPLVVKNDFRGTLASKSGFVNGLCDEVTIYLPKDPAAYINSVIYYSDTKEKTTEFYKLDNLNKKDTYTVFGGSNHPIYTIDTPVSSKKQLLLIKDSYANSLIPFLSQNYRKIVVVDPRYFYENIDDIIKSNGITDVLFVYNANTFFTDNSLEMMINS